MSFAWTLIGADERATVATQGALKARIDNKYDGALVLLGSHKDLRKHKSALRQS